MIRLSLITYFIDLQDRQCPLQSTIGYRELNKAGVTLRNLLSNWIIIQCIIINASPRIQLCPECVGSVNQYGVMRG